MTGTLYSVSVGAGDPGWLTLQAVQALGKCRIIAAPRVCGSMTALGIVQGAVGLSGKTLLPLDLPMGHARCAYETAANALCRALQSGDTALLCLGDASLYASAAVLCDMVRAQGYAVEICPGVPSFCAMAALRGEPLAMGDTPLQILPYGCEGFAERLQLPGAKIIMKCGSHMQALCGLLETLGLLDKAYAAQRIGMPDGSILTDLKAVGESGYFTTVYIAE